MLARDCWEMLVNKQQRTQLRNQHDEEEEVPAKRRSGQKQQRTVADERFAAGDGQIIQRAGGGIFCDCNNVPLRQRKLAERKNIATFMKLYLYPRMQNQSAKGGMAEITLLNDSTR